MSVDDSKDVHQRARRHPPQRWLPPPSSSFISLSPHRHRCQNRPVLSPQVDDTMLRDPASQVQSYRQGSAHVCSLRAIP